MSEVSKLYLFIFKKKPTKTNKIWVGQWMLTQQTWRSSYKAGHKRNLSPEAVQRLQIKFLNTATKVISDIFT